MIKPKSEDHEKYFCKQMATTLQAIDELSYFARGDSLEDLRDLRLKITNELKEQGYSVSYNGTNTMKVKRVK